MKVSTLRKAITSTKYACIHPSLAEALCKCGNPLYFNTCSIQKIAKSSGATGCSRKMIELFIMFFLYLKN